MIELTAATPLTSAEQHRENNNKTMFGFWVYIMTDCVLFATLFATFVVLRPNTFGGPSGRDIFNLPNVLAETLILLTSSFTCGLAMLAAHARRKQLVLFWLAVTFALGVAFLTLEITEFQHLIAEGNSFRRSGFLSGFFTIVATHGLHITAGLIWMIVMLQKIVSKGLSSSTMRRLTLFSLFWHFLDIVWIFIFSIVYMMGVV
ncbi:MAG: cytochrome o ubiquinol oxidase subunit III [Candidatus Saccharibacteria bacterium]